MKYIETLAYKISLRNRKKKYILFLKQINPNISESIIDVGVTNKEYSPSDNYLEKVYPYLKNITAVAPGSLELFRAMYPKIHAIEGDGRALPFKDNFFDIGYSNAALEHVGAQNDQCKFLSELYRVSKKGFLTTPNKNFPIEIHTRVPLLHILLPKQYIDRVFTWIGKNWAIGGYMRLLSERELHLLLKKSGIREYRVFKQRVLGFTMTFCVSWKKI